MSITKRVLVTGAGGFIGHHLTHYLVTRGYYLRGVDLKYPAYEPSSAQELELLDLPRFDNALIAFRGMDQVYHLAADTGGIGYIENNRGAIVRNNTLISLNTIETARIHSVERLLYTSSACVYPAYRQDTENVTPLREEDACPADAEDGCGWEKRWIESQLKSVGRIPGSAQAVERAEAA